jgi:hypothetical protein
MSFLNSENMSEENSLAMLRQRFKALWLRCLPEGSSMNADAVDAIYDELNTLYGDLSRFYHGWDHLIFCFWALDCILCVLKRLMPRLYRHGRPYRPDFCLPYSRCAMM